MKKLLLAVSVGVIFATPAVQAGEINNVITDSVQLTVNGASIQSTRMGSSYSSSGTNITVSALGGLTGGSATAPATAGTNTYAQSTAGQAFNFSESLTVGDTVVTSVTPDATDGMIDPPLYSDNLIYHGGTKGTLAGTLTPTGIGTATAGGQGTTVLTQRTVSLSVFD